MVDIYIPTKELIVPQSVSVGVAAYISWQVCKVGTNKVVREAGPYKNLITDSGLDRWIGNTLISTLVGNCVVGTGSSQPEEGDTNLDSQVASTSARTQIGTGVQTSSLPYYGWTRYEYEFGAGAAQGNLSELGFRQGTGDLFSRQLFRDELGQPTTITVLSDEFLRITYEIRKYLPSPVDNVQSQVNISGIEYEVTTRPGSVNTGTFAWSDTLVGPSGADSGVRAENTALTEDVTSSLVMGGFGGNDDSNSFGSYSPGTFARTVEAVWNPGTVTGQIQRALWGKVSGSAQPIANQRGQWQTGFNPPIQKSADDRLILQFYAEWGRA